MSPGFSWFVNTVNSNITICFGHFWGCASEIQVICKSHRFPIFHGAGDEIFLWTIGLGCLMWLGMGLMMINDDEWGLMRIFMTLNIYVWWSHVAVCAAQSSVCAFPTLLRRGDLDDGPDWEEDAPQEGLRWGCDVCSKSLGFTVGAGSW